MCNESANLFLLDLGQFLLLDILQIIDDSIYILMQYIHSTKSYFLFASLADYIPSRRLWITARFWQYTGSHRYAKVAIPPTSAGTCAASPIKGV